MLLLRKGDILKCRHCNTPMYEVIEDVGMGKIDLPDGKWKHATLLSVNSVRPIEPQTIGDTFNDCVNCGENVFGV